MDISVNVPSRVERAGIGEGVGVSEGAVQDQRGAQDMQNTLKQFRAGFLLDDCFGFGALMFVPSVLFLPSS